MFNPSPYSPFGTYQQGQDSQIIPVDSSAGLFRYQRNQFNMAGQKSFSTPPSQDQESFVQLYNTMPVTTGTLERRWGLVPLAQRFRRASRMVEVHNTNTTTRGIIISDATIAHLYDETNLANPLLIDSIFTFAGVTTPRYLVSRNVIYGTDGITAVKHTGIIGDVAHFWGISSATNATTAVNSGLYATHAADVIQTGLPAWIPASGLQGAPDSTYAVCTLMANPAGLSISQGINCDTFNYTLTPTNTISGIQVFITGHVDSAATTPVTISATLLKNDIPVGTTKSFMLTSTTDVTTTLGSSTDLWGATWQPSDFNATGFGVQIQASIAFGTVNRKVSLDAVKTVLYQNSSALTVGAPTGTGNITLTGGRTYFCAFRNSSSGHIGDLNTGSVSTGAVTSKAAIPLSNIPVSTAAQVDRKIILATADGNDTSKLYFVADIANATTTYSDTTNEQTLLLSNVYQETDEEGNEHGVALNTPPPLGTTILCKHQGRVYMLQGHTLYYSKNLDDLTTSTGLIVGVYEESWPGDYQLDISDQSETGSALFSDGTSLYIGTERHVRRIVGDGPSNFQKAPDIVFNNVGIVNQEVLQVVYVEDQPIGAMWLTPELKVMLTDFNSYRNVGKDVQDVLNSINRSALSTAHAAYYGSGIYSFYALAIPTGTNTDPDTVLIYDLNRHVWHVWQFPVKVTFMYYNILIDGTPRLLIGGYYLNPDGSNNYWVYTIDSSALTDALFILGPPIPIVVTLKTPWIHFGDPASRKDMNELEVFTPDANMTLAIAGASNSNEFTSPTNLLNKTLSISPFGERKFYLASEQTRDRFYQFTFTSADTANRSVMDALKAEVVLEHRF